VTVSSRPGGPAHPDRGLLWSAGFLLALGLVFVASASAPVAARLTGEPFHFAYRQGGHVLMGMAAAWLIVRFVSLSRLQAAGPGLLGATAVLLAAMLVPGLGHEVNGSVRWIRLGGALNIQVSEVAKLVSLIYVAGYLSRHRDAVRESLWGAVRPLLPLAVVGGLILAQPDLGAAAVMLATAFVMVFLAGMRLLPIMLTMLVSVLALAPALYFSPYRLARLTSFRNPWQDPFGDGFQLTQSLIAIGRGELTGVGIGDSVQKLFYLPEAHTDFIFAVMAEELGFLGVLVLLGLYTVLVWRCFALGVRAEASGRSFGAHLAYGVGVWFALQALINLGVNMGLLPTKGLTLPLVSYGGSSALVMCLALGLVLRLDRELSAPTGKRKRAGARKGGAGRATAQVAAGGTR
jgi:cell division protein FtsW